MKVKSSLIVPIIAASILAPTIGNTMANHKTDSFKACASMQKEDQNGTHQKWVKVENQKELMNIINQYASPQLKAQLTKDLTDRESLMEKLRQTPGFHKKKNQEKAFYQAHRQKVDAIIQQVKDGKLTEQQAQKQLKEIFKKEHGKHQDKGDFNQELKSAIQKKDKAAINSALEKFDQKLESSNQHLQQKINDNK